jgi:DNA (cytosine-5)-methyltransferase 1
MQPKPTYIDLFAGCGGLSTGLHLAGWQGLFAVERNATAFETLKANLIDKKEHFNWPAWLETTNWDIEALLTQKTTELRKLRGTVDLVVGGPPCQGFSTAGRRRETDKRNNLVHAYLTLVELVRPRAILFENVRGFTMKFRANATDGAAYSQIVIHRLQALGYSDARGEIIDMSEYGVPQKRQRFIVIATTSGHAPSVYATLKKVSTLKLREWRIPIKNGAHAALGDLARAHGTTECPDTPGFHSGRAGSALSGLQIHLRFNSRTTIPDSHRFVNHTPQVTNVFKRLLATAPRNSCILGDAREAYGLKKRSVTVLDAKKPAPTITTIPDDFVHYNEPRVMTVRECARLQTFPDWFEFKGPYTTGGKQRSIQAPRYTQVGNAVPPLFAHLVGLAVMETLPNA